MCVAHICRCDVADVVCWHWMCGITHHDCGSCVALRDSQRTFILDVGLDGMHHIVSVMCEIAYGSMRMIWQ